jgi:CxxC motif-containing protein (DUF1111 family)
MRMLAPAIALILSGLAVAMAGDQGITAPATDFQSAERYEANQGGAGTFTGSLTANAFSQPAANITLEQRLDFFVGNGFFRRLWVSAPASTTSADGLGPLYNARGCQNCHLKDGRGHTPTANWPDDNAVSMFLRLSVPPRTPEEIALIAGHRVNVIPDPTYGGQLQDFAVPGLQAEGHMAITYEEIPVTLGDGEVVSLRAPTYTITDLAYGPADPDLMISPRVAPPMIGLGLLEAIDPADILARVDPDDADGDGISGRANTVWDEIAGAPTLGRFGWKAGEPHLAQQNAHAFGGDVGISNPLSLATWGDCTAGQTACREASQGGDDDGMEAGDAVMEKLLFYTRNLAVPARRDVDDDTVLAGKRAFYETGCISCHTPKYVTVTLADLPELSHQLIWPYTDLLLHDMGPGLADHRPEGQADGAEWRTPPLWGIGLTQAVSGHSQFLHDGRARSLTEAILWHGSEAQDARDRFAAMPREEREALITFLESL